MNYDGDEMNFLNISSLMVQKTSWKTCYSITIRLSSLILNETRPWFPGRNYYWNGLTGAVKLS